MTFDLSNYVDVATRIKQLRDKHPEAVLRPFDPANPFKIVEIGGREFIVYTAACFRSPDDNCPAVAVAAEPVIGASSFTRNSEVMNAETSAWGRAIMACLAVDEPHIASRDEVINRRNDEQHATPTTRTEGNIIRVVKDAFPDATLVETPQTTKVRQLGAVASEKQLNLLHKLAREHSIANLNQHASDVVGRHIDELSLLTSKEASAVIKSLMSS
jgi:hypothetical protein